MNVNEICRECRNLKMERRSNGDAVSYKCKEGYTLTKFVYCTGFKRKYLCKYNLKVFLLEVLIFLFILLALVSVLAMIIYLINIVV
ncbi:MAG: hypothetical protein IJH65_04425 [Methanobrevibacter sp.]|nr:hypothetical protein [Methanobrevibacter sp.]